MSANPNNQSRLENPTIASKLHERATRAHSDAEIKAAEIGQPLAGHNRAVIAAQVFIENLPKNAAFMRGENEVLRDIENAVCARRIANGGRPGPEYSNSTADVTPGSNPFFVNPETDPESAFASDWAKSVEEVGKLPLPIDLSQQDFDGIGAMIELARNPEKQKLVQDSQPDRSKALPGKRNVSSDNGPDL